MVTVLLWILIHVGTLPIYSNRQSTIRLWCGNGIKEGDGTILLVIFHCKLYGWVNTINVFKEVLLKIFLLDDKCVFQLPKPHSRGWVAVLRAFCSKYSMCSLATAPLLDTIGLRGCLACGSWRAHRMHCIL